jgi:hypothetical protein
MNPIDIIKTLYLYSKAEGTAWLFIAYIILLVFTIGCLGLFIIAHLK